MFGKKKSKNTDDGAVETATEAVEETETAETAEAGGETETASVSAPEDVVKATEEAVSATTDTLTVPEADMAILNRFRLAGEDCVKELGNIEIRKARIIASYGQLEAASQNKLREIGEALGIAEGSGWSVNPDGTVEVQTTPGAMGEAAEAPAGG